VSKELTSWTRLLRRERLTDVVGETLASIIDLGKVAVTTEDDETFKQCLLDLARVAEEVAESYEPVPAGPRIIRQNIPASTEGRLEEILYNGASYLIDQYTELGKKVPTDIVLVSDALFVQAFVFMEAPKADESAQKVGSNFLATLGSLGLSGAKLLNGDAVRKVSSDLEILSNRTAFKNSEPMNDAMAYSALEIGMVTEANLTSMRIENKIESVEVTRDRLVRCCSRCSKDALRSAMSNLYKRGHTTYIPDKAQESFVLKLEGEVGFNVRALSPRGNL
jgi:hypothetical protein